MTEPPTHRRGRPAPMLFHLAAAALSYQQACAVAAKSADPDFPWHPDVAPDLSAAPDLLELATASAHRLSGIVAGIEAWQRHPYRRKVEKPPVLWQSGSTRLLDYGATPEATRANGPPVLVIPSLINRAYILDLLPDRSLLRSLARADLRPILLDWGAPGYAEHGFDIDAYGTERLLPAIAVTEALTGQPASLLGYCMGGTLATGLAARYPDRFPALALIGAPWDFAGGAGLSAQLRTLCRAHGADALAAQLDAVANTFGLVPVDLFQLFFGLVNPTQAARKFQRFARLDPASTEALRFTALEDWLADGVPMAGPAARNLLIDWNLRNLTADGRWSFLGGPVRVEKIRTETLVVTGCEDTIAPPGMSAPLAGIIPGATHAQTGLGHVGMIVGSAAKQRVWTPVADFLGR